MAAGSACAWHIIEKGRHVLLLFAGGHRMGSTYQYLIVRNALRQLSIPFQAPDQAALSIFHLQKVRQSLTAADEHPETYFLGKGHPAFAEQAEAVMTAKNSRIFLVWRDQQDALVSDFHFAQRRAGHVYANFNDYFVRRGRKILLRNCLQNVVWKHIEDDRVRAWDYLRLVHDFENAATEMLDFAGLKGVDLAALKESVSIKELRKSRNDPKGTFFRKGGKQDIGLLEPSPSTMQAIEEITSETDANRLAAEFEKEDRLRTLVFGRECQEAGLRKNFHWWLFATQNAKYLRKNVLPGIYKLSPRRIAPTRRASSSD
jgi:sulfotransferase family protein